LLTRFFPFLPSRVVRETLMVFPPPFSCLVVPFFSLAFLPCPARFSCMLLARLLTWIPELRRSGKRQKRSFRLERRLQSFFLPLSFSSAFPLGRRAPQLYKVVCCTVPFPSVIGLPRHPSFRSTTASDVLQSFLLPLFFQISLRALLEGLFFTEVVSVSFFCNGRPTEVFLSYGCACPLVPPFFTFSFPVVQFLNLTPRSFFISVLSTC